jgi:hypothetical protein
MAPSTEPGAADVLTPPAAIDAQTAGGRSVGDGPACLT